MTDEDGYTLVEAVMALLMVGLAVMGLTQSLYVVTGGLRRFETDRTRLAESTQLRRALAVLPTNAGPFTAPVGRPSHSFTGDEHEMSYACGRASPCDVTLSAAVDGTWVFVQVGGDRRELIAHHLPDLHLQYVSAIDGAGSPTWPSARAGDRLAAAVLWAAGSPQVVIRFLNEQDGFCAFDISLGQCGLGAVMPNEHPGS